MSSSSTYFVPSASATCSRRLLSRPSSSPALGGSGQRAADAARRRGHRRAGRRTRWLPSSLGVRPPDLGLAGVRRYLDEQLPAEENIECWFALPIASGNRAAVEWWASWTEQGQELSYAGVTVLRFDDQGQVVEHRDYDNHVEGREPPYPGW